MNKIFLSFLAALISLTAMWPTTAVAAGISPSGGGSFPVGQTFTITVRASGATFDSLQGNISVNTTNAQIVSFSAGSATWLPGKAPANNNQFVGIVSPTSSLTVATIRLKGTKIGSGSVTVSGARLARSGSEVGSSGGTTNFSIVRAATPPGGVTVTSATHPDQNIAYEATRVELSWQAPANGADGYSYVFDETPETVPGTTINTKDVSLVIEGATVATHYFHIRAHNGDGWGPTTHFKVVVKEPDAKVDETLTKATIISVEKNSNFKTDLTTGTIRGITLKGTVAGDYVAIVSFEQKERLPQTLLEPLPVAPVVGTTPEDTGAVIAPEATSPPEVTAEPTAVPAIKTVKGVDITSLMDDTTSDGNWEIAINEPLPSGFYKLTVHGQNEKVLTPASDPVYLELSVANGGSVKFITDDDLPKAPSSGLKILGVQFRQASHAWIALASGVVVLGLVGGLIYILRKQRRPLSSQLH